MDPESAVMSNDHGHGHDDPSELGETDLCVHALETVLGQKGYINLKLKLPRFRGHFSTGSILAGCRAARRVYRVPSAQPNDECKPAQAFTALVSSGNSPAPEPWPTNLRNPRSSTALAYPG